MPSWINSLSARSFEPGFQRTSWRFKKRTHFADNQNQRKKKSHSHVYPLRSFSLGGSTSTDHPGLLRVSNPQNHPLSPKCDSARLHRLSSPHHSPILTPF